MEENKQFLKYIYNEDLYIVEEMEESKESTKTQSVNEIETKADLSETNPSIVQESKPVNFFGANEKGILILVNDPTNDFLNQKDLEFLMTIIEGGLRLSKSDIALVNSIKYPYQQILDEIAHKYLISFNENEIILQESKPRYQVIEKDFVKMLFAEKLSTIEADNEKKKLLWKALKGMFNL